MSEEIKDIMDALENNELKNDGFWGRACSRLSQQLQAAKEENKKLNKLHAFLHNKFNWSKEDVWIRNYLSSYIFDEEMVSDGKEYISPLKQILDLTQQNKQMRENINNVKNLCNEDWEDMTVDKFQNQLLQTLKGVE